ncbi:putative NLP/P60 family protein (secreted protein) (Partial match) [Frankia canadensis]|uniref:Putative NLP/P60 family protein (Secreted protein) (Partial match) n=2 Tax=Frankia canadensis TaxID=1836972 RepID=A0A2I2KIQ6_9ACTN|nr:putative NLP/P60 family protein (secreted protein) (Partial match) [Frankia canadensis]SOU52841.1 putative NLP/P60 family protein (secreted protein) (Partial match) [Frankia canadensis]
MAWLPEDWEQFVRGRQRPPAPRASSGAGTGTARRRTTAPPRRAVTIAAFTTGTIAASTAAFAATVPSGTDGAASLDANALTSQTHEAALIPGQSGGSSGDLNAARTLAPLASAIADHDSVFTNVSISADKTNVAPNTPVVLTVRATEADSGAPLANQDVRIVVVNGPQWQTSTRLHTDANGNAQITARLLSTTTITAVFDGSSALRPSLAGAATVTISSPTRGGSGAGGLGGVGGSGSAIDQAIPTVIPGSSIGDKAVYLASLNKGKPYVWGAEGPYSFDCSGLVQYVFKQLGRSLPRTAQGQYNVSTKVPQSGKQPGDLIFYGTPGNIYHVGIYAGNGYMWAAPQTGGVVSLRPIYSSTYKVGRIH